MARLKGWERWEADLQQDLGLSATLNSGNKFWDSGDAVDNDGASSWPLYADAKYTTLKSFSVKRDEVAAWVTRAEMLGKRFLLAIRFFDERNPRLAADYVLMPKNDYEELLVKAGLR